MNDKEETNERTPPPTVPLGVSKFPPPLAVQNLVSAAYQAKLFKPGSFDRRREIENAILVVKAQWPKFFRKN